MGNVPTGARGEQLTTVFSLSTDLLATCINATANNNHFPHKLTRELGEPVVAIARKIMHSVYEANKEKRPARREEFVNDALLAMEDLQAEIHLNFLRFKLKARKAGEISDILTELRTRFINWSKSVS